MYKRVLLVVLALVADNRSLSLQTGDENVAYSEDITKNTGKEKHGIENSPPENKEKPPEFVLTQGQIDGLADKILKAHGIQLGKADEKNLRNIQHLKKVVATVGKNLENLRRNKAEPIAENVKPTNDGGSEFAYNVNIIPEQLAPVYEEVEQQTVPITKDPEEKAQNLDSDNSDENGRSSQDTNEVSKAVPVNKNRDEAQNFPEDNEGNKVPEQNGKEEELQNIQESIKESDGNILLNLETEEVDGSIDDEEPINGYFQTCTPDGSDCDHEEKSFYLTEDNAGEKVKENSDDNNVEVTGYFTKFTNYFYAKFLIN